MPTAFDRPEFAPPPEPGLLRGLALAILAHLLLIVALTTGLQWKRGAENATAEAELWAAMPQQAAPKAVQAPPAPPPPVVKAPPPPEPPVQREAQIALEREKQRREAAERQRQAELERERERRRKEAAERQRREELAKKREAEKRAADDARRKEEERRRREREEQERRLAQLREENLRRIQGLAGGTGAPASTGSAAQSSGPSASWAGRVQARVRPNIVFPDIITGNPATEVEVRLAPDGTIMARRIIKSSGNRNWDDAVLRALDKTQVLPRDVDGRVPTPVVIEFRPKG